MKSIEISTKVFAAIWSARIEGEETEDQILSRIFGIQKNSRHDKAAPLRKVSGKTRWVDDVVQALDHLGGEAAYNDIYKEVRNIRIAAGRSAPKSFQEVVRKEIETHSTDSEAFAGREDYFFAPKGIGGLFDLAKQHKKPEVKK